MNKQGLHNYIIIIIIVLSASVNNNWEYLLHNHIAVSHTCAKGYARIHYCLLKFQYLKPAFLQPELSPYFQPL